MFFRVKMTFFLTLITLSMVYKSVETYPTGAPLVACEQMVPYHPATTTSGQPPFTINITETAYKPGSVINGVVYSPSGVQFKGLLIQGRLSAGGIDPIGTFEVVDNRTHTNCGKGNQQALTHSNNAEKTSIPFRWIAPDSSAGNVHFKLTVVESYNVSRFWLKIYSQEIQDCSLNETVPQCKQIQTTVPPKTTQPASLSTKGPILSTTPGGKIPYDSGCGSTKSCYPNCPDGCDYLVTWQQSETNDDGVHFDIKMMLNYTTNVWIAVGLSPLGTMNQTNVVACLLDGSTGVSVQSSLNVGYSNVLFPNKTLGLSEMEGQLNGNIFQCSYTRENKADNNHFWDLSDEFFLLAGTGPVQNGAITKHDHMPFMSNNKMNFLAHPTTQTVPVSTTPPGGKIPYDSGCGSTKSCYPNCPDGCDYLVTWQQSETNDDGVHFDIKMILNYTTNVWIAVGLSPLGTMNQTNVVACLLDGSTGVSVQSSLNVGYSNVLFPNKTLGLSEMEGQLNGNIFQCSYTRENKADNNHFWDLSDEFFLLAGTGPVQNGAITKHDHMPFMSNNKMNFLAHPTTQTVPVSTTPPGGKIPYDSGCGSTKSCYPNCPDGCDYLVTWQQSETNDDGVHFDIKMILNYTTNVWIAVGLSPLGTMNQTNVVACLLDGSTGVSVQSSLNVGYSNVLFPNKTLGLSEMEGQLNGNIFQCSYTRENKADNNHFWDLSDEFFLLAGTGPVQNGAITKHDHMPFMSNNKMNFLAHPTTQTVPVSTTPSAGGKIPFDTGCGTTKGCFPDCPDGCDYLVTWQHGFDNGEDVQFDISMKVENTQDVWIAVGLSKTGKMDQTNVGACMTHNSKVSLLSSHNVGYTNVLFANETLGLSNMKAHMADSIFTCSFTRQKSMNHSNFWDLSHEMYLLVGTGPVVNGAMTQHTQIPHKSDKQINFMANSTEGQSKSAPLLVKLHGSLMVVAWMLCSSIGIVVARHGKSLMGSQLLCNLKYWFVVHRLLMSTAALCVIVAVVVIFVEVGGFSKISAEGSIAFTKAHPYVGIAVTVFTILNPIMAMCRPAPDSKERYKFNWAHFSVGTCAHILAIINIGFSIKLPSAMVNDAARYVISAYAAAFMLVHTTLECHTRNKNNKKTGNTFTRIRPPSAEYIPISEDTYVRYSSNTKDGELTVDNSSGPLMPVLFIHCLLMLASAVVFILMICYPTIFESI